MDPENNNEELDIVFDDEGDTEDIYQILIKEKKTKKRMMLKKKKTNDNNKIVFNH